MLDDFYKTGYAIIECNDKVGLLDLQQRAFSVMSSRFNMGLATPLTESFAKMHILNKDVKSDQLNTLKMACLGEFSKPGDFNRLMYRCFSNSISSILGPDILIQKGVNLVIQFPNDPEPSEIHRDFPSMSAFEMVLWVPLVHCELSRSMFMVNRDDTLKLNELRAESPSMDWLTFRRHVLTCAREIKVDFGQAIIFSTTLIHGSNVNITPYTRVSFNARFKSIFSPPGLKDQNEYFEVLEVSPLTKIGFDAFKRKISAV